MSRFSDDVEIIGWAHGELDKYANQQGELDNIAESKWESDKDHE